MRERQGGRGRAQGKELESLKRGELERLRELGREGGREGGKKGGS